ncbi:bacterio-opsin activator domain-containing protein [Natrialba asiatica]|uniref:Response regulator receiver modulated GAF sensor protein n=1 Tax=Natrialba asiatica (strain ATCC 700177 / DSM 12278 / JCM 9576 / FERM P-10747 / NBRC 102637 / 172P1) TaxID=29540 RepID=M0AKK2_NATA1|nr:bacterio-opsin activator domain-containing protein [Natrialba asiatica]ELY99245.1 response regulator receiver modulated GAF sensor protein [Natrialba asiatica DSM 12278]
MTESNPENERRNQSESETTTGSGGRDKLDTTTATPEQSETLRALLIEDNPGDARLIEEMLRDTEELAQRVSSSESAEQTPEIIRESRLADGLETFEQSAVDVVLLDLNLPDSQGLETLETVSEASDTTPIVVLTGLRDQQVGIQAIQQGAQDFLVKDEVTSELLVRTIHHAIERARQEHERRRQREQLEAINRLNDIGHDIIHAVITTETRAELEQRVCDRLTASDGYRFAWIGEVNPGSDDIVPKAAAGVENGYLEAVEISADEGEPTGQGPAGTAIRTGTVQVANNVDSDPEFEPWREEAESRGYQSSVANNVDSDPEFEPWREEAESRGYQSSASIPIIHEDLIYGVLNVYASSPRAFTAPETQILARIGDTIAHAITAIERRDALVSDAVIELEFRLEEMVPELVALTDTESRTISIKQLIRGDEALLAYGTAQDISREAFEEAVEQSEGVTAVRFLSVKRDEFEFELVIPAAASLFEAIATHGGRVESATIADSEFRFVVELPRGRDTRQMIELIKEHRADATYLAQRTTERSERDDSGSGGSGAGRRMMGVLEDDLTEKQRAALETAYFAGYFDWPRESTGEEIADRLGIAPATFNQHLRTAERKFFDSALGE